MSSDACCFCDRPAKWVVRQMKGIGALNDGRLSVCHHHSETALECQAGEHGASVQRVSGRS